MISVTHWSLLLHFSLALCFFELNLLPIEIVNLRTCLTHKNWTFILEYCMSFTVMSNFYQILADVSPMKVDCSTECYVNHWLRFFILCVNLLKIEHGLEPVFEL